MAWSNVANATFTTLADVTISSVEDVNSGQAQLWWGKQAYIHGSGFGASQGTSTVSIEDNLSSENIQTVDTWTDTRLTLIPSRGNLAGGKFTIHLDKD